MPPEGIIGAWNIGDNGTPTGEYQANPRYRSAPLSTGTPGWKAALNALTMYYGDRITIN